MATYKTPGVYVEEISTLPPSVAEVSTAIPAFLGYTARGPKMARITTLLEYETIFGGSQTKSFNVSTEVNDTGAEVVKSITRDTSNANKDFFLYYALSLYFKNGGGACYVFSVGDYAQAINVKHFEDALKLVEKEDEPTLIVFPDAVNLSSTDYYSLCQAALAQCSKLGDRFAILDVLSGNGKVAEFRDKIGTDSLAYGAAYYPYLKSALSYQYKDADVSVGGNANAGQSTWSKAFGDSDKGIIVKFVGPDTSTPSVKIVSGQANDPVDFSVSNTLVLTINDVASETGLAVVEAWDTWVADPANDSQGFSVVAQGDGSDGIPNTSNANVPLDKEPTQAAGTLDSIKVNKTALYNQVKTQMTNQRIEMPPSAAIAGIYARVDRTRGVWKSPANVSLSSVIGPSVKVTHDEQENLNVDPTAGKSINAIRDFTGKGTLVWGARTLAGNDNEWRYVSVRRLFNMIEESTKKASAFAVFEPNDNGTWFKVKAMCESYLYGLWEKGALAGPTPESAYFVNVGLGKTMTNQDILEGRMIVEIGVAAVRPAEFIILKFSHKMQEA